MKVLVLDDDKNRHKTFARNLIGNEKVVHAFTYQEAVDALAKEKFDAVFLDHDLNDNEHQSVDHSGGYGGPRELTGVDVALFIARLPPEQHPTYAIVHSFNPSGAMNMVAVLKTTESQVIRDPFHPNSGKLSG